MRFTARQWAIVGFGCVGLAMAFTPVLGQSLQKSEQNMLGPGMYAFQTRVRASTCGDAEPDGYVLTYVTTIDGIPGSATMKMEVVNSEYFKEWTLKITDSQVVGDSKIGSAAAAPESHFEVKREGDRFKGKGSRSYNGSLNGKAQRCSVTYDALLRRVDA